MRDLLAGAFRSHLVSRGVSLHEDEMRDAVVVFAPHPDDETLGCGGTIRKRVEAGGHVQVAFMTDGAASHTRHVSKAELVRMRELEAVRAGKELGLSERALSFFGFPDGELGRHHEAAMARVRSLLLDARPRAVYVPHHADGPADHQATTECVLAASRGAGLRLTVFEYPVWLWHSFPWVSMDRGRGLREGFAAGLRAQRAFLRDLRCVVPLGRARFAKLRALRCYTSQMTRFRGAADWPTLGHVAGGDFLQALLSEHELFQRYEMGRGQPSDSWGEDTKPGRGRAVE